jgi:hypothetical protein
MGQRTVAVQASTHIAEITSKVCSGVVHSIFQQIIDSLLNSDVKVPRPSGFSGSSRLAQNTAIVVPVVGCCSGIVVGCHVRT